MTQIEFDNRFSWLDDEHDYHDDDEDNNDDHDHDYYDHIGYHLQKPLLFHGANIWWWWSDDDHNHDHDENPNEDYDDQHHHGHLQQPLLFQIGGANASKAAAITFSSAAPQTPAVLLIIANF